MSQYTNFLSLAKQHNISAFTPLQDVAFRSECILNPKRDLFVIGETSSGKTLIPLLIYEMSVSEMRRSGGYCPKMLFVVPYRALAAQKKLEFDQHFEKYDLNIVQSTGEFRQYDQDILSGDVDVAVIITEKVFKFQARMEEFLSKYDFLVLDEVGLIDDAERGIYFDFLFAWGANTCRKSERLRMIALGTPFYNWDIYIKYYNFYLISTDSGRPVQLEKNTIFFNKAGISQIDGKCDIMYRTRIWTVSKLEKIREIYGQPFGKCSDLGFLCPIETPCRNDRSLLCEKIKTSCTSPAIILPENVSVYQYILLKICCHHLLQGHQILIFFNNREEVINMSMFLYQSLRRIPELVAVFPDPPSEEKCRKAILGECGLSADDVYGILEYEDRKEIKRECYQAFVSGIAFHNAALPNELRTYVEMKLLASSEMKIVCSTETLAFGINSSVDVVVIANLMKQENSLMRMITMNEYRNYAGRAGRLRVGVEPNQMKGTIYTLVQDSQKESWYRMQTERPICLQSLFYNNAAQKMPFFLLNLISDNVRDGVDYNQLLEIAGMMPRDTTNRDGTLEVYVKDAVDFLLKHGLLEEILNPVSRGRRYNEKKDNSKYYLTKLGSCMKGYILEKSDYQNLKDAVGTYVNSVYLEPDRVTFIYRLLCTKHASSALNSVYDNSDTRVSFEILCDYIQSKGRNFTVECPPSWLRESNKKNIYVLAAVLAWCDGESAKSIYNKYGMHYALLNKLAEQISYLVKIAKELIPECMESNRRALIERCKLLTRENQAIIEDLMGDESFTKQCDEKIADAEKLSASLYFGINTVIHKEIMDYLEQGGEEAIELINRYALKSLSPVTAREFREIVLAYSFFQNPVPKKWKNSEERNNYISLRRQQYLAMKKGYPLIFRFFKIKFEDTFTDKID